jgi:hypothetical protein
MMQVPRGPKELKCPIWKKSMAACCHTCPWWVKVSGKNPQSTEEVDRWDCAVGWLPMIGIENAQQSRQTGAAVEGMRNQTAATRQALVAIAERAATAPTPAQSRPLIDISPRRLGAPKRKTKRAH